MVEIPAGSFIMGAAESESRNRKFGWGGPEIKVTIARPFALAKTEITRTQFATFMRESGHRQEGRCRSIWEKRIPDPSKVSWLDPQWPDGSQQADDHPVVCIAWEDAIAYAAWLTRKSGGRRVYDLPSEAEFEYAARAGTVGARPWPGAAEESCKYANVGDRNYLKIIPDYGAIDCDDGYAFTSPVSAFPANAFGLHDMLGNVWEWVRDCRAADLAATPRDGRALEAAPADCTRRVLRSSGYSSAEWYTRVTTRGGDPVPGTRLVVLGFRVAARERAPEAQLSPVRRTTIASADPDASLRFYRDLLGFTVEYDVMTTEPGQLATFAPGAGRGRAIALRQGDRMGGSIGLFHTPGMKRGGQCRTSAAGGAVAILLLTNDLDALYRRLKAAGVPFLNAPHTYDSRRGIGPTGTFTVFDPDCVRVAFAQIQNETLEQSERR